MRVIDGIAYADDGSEPILAVSVRALPGFRLDTRFTDGERREFDLSPLLDSPAFAPLRDEAAFQAVYLDRGVPMWCDGLIDLSPSKILVDGVPLPG